MICCCLICICPLIAIKCYNTCRDKCLMSCVRSGSIVIASGSDSSSRASSATSTSSGQTTSPHESPNRHGFVPPAVDLELEHNKDPPPIYSVAVNMPKPEHDVTSASSSSHSETMTSFMRSLSSRIRRASAQVDVEQPATDILADIPSRRRHTTASTLTVTRRNGIDNNGFSTDPPSSSVRPQFSTAAGAADCVHNSPQHRNATTLTLGRGSIDSVQQQQHQSPHHRQHSPTSVTDPIIEETGVWHHQQLASSPADSVSSASNPARTLSRDSNASADDSDAELPSYASVTSPKSSYVEYTGVKSIGDTRLHFSYV